MHHFQSYVKLPEGELVQKTLVNYFGYPHLDHHFFVQRCVPWRARPKTKVGEDPEEVVRFPDGQGWRGREKSCEYDIFLEYPENLMSTAISYIFLCFII